MLKYFFKVYRYMQRRVTIFIALLSAINFLLGIFVLMYGVTLFESHHIQPDFIRSETNRDLSAMKKGFPSIQRRIKNASVKENHYDNYFRIEYIIEQAICHSVDIFKTDKAIHSIENITRKQVQKFLSKNFTIQLKILRIDATINSSNKTLNEDNHLLCNYTLEFFIRIKFPFNCDNQCQFTFNENFLGNRSDSILDFSLSNGDSSTLYHIHQIIIHRSMKYLERIVSIQSIVESRYVSIDTVQSLISMSIKQKELFRIQKGFYSFDNSSIYVSFRLLSLNHTYLRHEYGRMEISDDDQSNLFRRDATFKIVYDDQNDMVAFQTTNLLGEPCICLNNDKKPKLVIKKCEELPVINDLDDRCMFKLIIQS